MPIRLYIVSNFHNLSSTITLLIFAVVIEMIWRDATDAIKEATNYGFYTNTLSLLCQYTARILRAFFYFYVTIQRSARSRSEQ